MSGRPKPAHRRSSGRHHGAHARRAPRRHAPVGLALAAVLAATAVGIGLAQAGGGGAPTDAPHRAVHALDLFPSSSFDDRLSSRTPIVSDSATLVGNLLHQIHASGRVGVNNLDYGIPIFVIPPNTPSVRITVDRGCGDFLPSTGDKVPIPDNAVPAAGSDASLIVYQPSTGSDWEFWKAHKEDNGTWEACWGGRIENMRRSDGVFAHDYGVAGSGIAYLATLITFSDVEAGVIDHTIPLTVTSCHGLVAPADRSDCHNPAGEVAEGTLLRFPANLATPAGLTRFGRLVFRAIRDYGAVVQDQSVGVYVGTEDSATWGEEGHRGIDPITESFDGRDPSAALNGIPWSRLEVVAVPRRI